MQITTPESWWQAVDEHFANLLTCFSNSGADLSDSWWSDGYGKEPVDHGIILATHLERARKNRDHNTLLRLFHLCWEAAPDSPQIHRWPSWDVLCDLCSENWVFYPELVKEFRKD